MVDSTLRHGSQLLYKSVDIIPEIFVNRDFNIFPGINCFIDVKSGNFFKFGEMMVYLSGLDIIFLDIL